MATKRSKAENKEASPRIENQVHSANSWETADLGNDERKNKFLRLMGATKKEHTGRFTIGDHNPSHYRSVEDNQKLEDSLETQFSHGLEDKLKGRSRKHIGLGYSEEKTEEENKDSQEEEKEIKKDFQEKKTQKNETSQEVVGKKEINTEIEKTTQGCSSISESDSPEESQRKATKDKKKKRKIK